MSVDFSGGYPCPMCQRSFATFEDMDAHIRLEADEAMRLVGESFDVLHPPGIDLAAPEVDIPYDQPRANPRSP